MMYVVTSYFNPENYQTKRDNFYKFIAPLEEKNIPWFCVEAIFGTETNPLAPHKNILKVQTKDVMWHKERMLNLAEKHLPKRCETILWIDCDIIFENEHWYEETEFQLDTFAVVQPFENVVRLAKGQDTYVPGKEQWSGKSFAAVYLEKPSQFLNGHFDNHGHTGFAWATHRSIIAKHGLYDACIAGSGDHMMAHAFLGDWYSPCVQREVGVGNKHHKHFEKWCENVYKDVKANVGYSTGRILHLWHGDIRFRKYAVRNHELHSIGYDPKKDIRPGKNGLYEWTKSGKRIEQWAIDYFKHRQEDKEDR